jgi:hypothetical protein
VRNIGPLEKLLHTCLALVVVMATVPMAIPPLKADDRKRDWYQEKFRILRFRPQWTSSDCIGDPKTPLCAAETLLACYLRENAEMCHMIGWDVTWKTNPNPRREAPGSDMIVYHVTNEKELHASDISEEPRKGKYAWQAGDVAVRMMVFFCSGSQHCFRTREGSPSGKLKDCPPVSCRLGGYGSRKSDLKARSRITITRKIGDSWHVVQNILGDYNLPPSFWDRK